jgi:phenylacetate-CoA ligase
LETQRHLRELEKTQWFSREELESWQFAKLKHLVQFAFDNVPYYHDRYRREGIHPKDIQSLQEFQSLPILTKEDINQHLDALVSTDLRSKAQLNQTGGSTGQPMRFFVEDSFWWWNTALEFRGREWHGVHQGDKIAWVWGAQRDMPSWRWPSRFKAYIMRHRYLNAFSMTVDKMKAFAELLGRWQPTMLIAYPSALTVFAKYIQEHQITGIRPRLIETTAEKVTDSQRQLLEEVFQCKVVDYYSSRELGAIAYECEEGRRHVYETRFLETISNGGPVQSGQLGKIVVTSLNQFLMPLIRYENGDMGICEDTKCLCGRSLPILKEIVGRMNDFLVTTDGQFVHSQSVDYIIRVKPEVTRYQVYQPDRKHLEVRLVTKQIVDQVWLEAARSELKARFGADMSITLRVVDDIALTPAGKHRYIISDVTPDF